MKSIEDVSIIYTYKSDKTTPHRDTNFDSSLESLSGIIPDANVVIVNFGNENQKWKHIENKYTVINVEKCFSRGLGNNIGAKLSKTDNIFFLDIDMLIGADFFSHLKHKKGECHFPICFSIFEGKESVISEKNGWWRDSGFGMSIFNKDDFFNLGGFIENSRWGGEDTILYVSALKKLKVHRGKSENLIHQWHPDDLKYKNKFYNDGFEETL